MTLRTLDASATAALLPYPALAEELRYILADKRAGLAHAPVRMALTLPGDGTLLVMPASDPRLAITKLVTVHPKNAGSASPVVQADVLVMDAVTGERLVMLDGATVTARRTAAISLLAALTLAPVPQGPLLIVGSGVEARAHMEALAEGLGVREVRILSQNPQHAARLALQGREMGLNATVAESAGEACLDAGLIVTATTSNVPVLPDVVRSDVFVAAVGAYRPDSAELPASLVRRARLYVDTLEGCREEAGDLILAGVNWSKVVPLEEALSGGRPSDGPVVF